jgi:nitrilase
MTDRRDTLTVAAVQAAPVLFDQQATVAKACGLIRDAAERGSALILFPEAFIPAYPRGFSFGTVVGSRSPKGRLVWQRYWENCIDVPGPATEKIGEAVRKAGVHLALGVIERDSRFSGGTLFCTLLYFGPDGRLIGKHRKLKPTASERLIWGEGDGSTLTVIDTPFGRVGGLICWENYMPLARAAMYGKGVEIYLAPTADHRDAWQSTLRHIALEGRCFVIGCNQFFTREMVPKDLREMEGLERQPEIMCRGGSAVVSPLGEVLAGPLYDREDILLCTIDLKDVPRSKFDFDVVGHYARPDVFQLIVNERPLDPVTFDGRPETE